MRYIILISSLVLTACGGSNLPPPRRIIEYVEVPVPVATGCIAEAGRPDKVSPLNKTVPPPQWEVLPPGSKAENVRAQAGKRMNYTDELEAVTSACK